MLSVQRGWGETTSLYATTSKESVGLISQMTSDKTWGNSFKLHQGRFRFGIGKHLFMERVLRNWSGLPREVVDSPSLEAFERDVDMAVSDTVQWWNSVRWVDSWTWSWGSFPTWMIPGFCKCVVYTLFHTQREVRLRPLTAQTKKERTFQQIVIIIYNVPFCNSGKKYLNVMYQKVAISSVS